MQMAAAAHTAALNMRNNMAGSFWLQDGGAYRFKCYRSCMADVHAAA
jgi:hypothetical protein